eukprot:1158672-Pelagomonas_calceolata.AAC.17
MQRIPVRRLKGIQGGLGPAVAGNTFYPLWKASSQLCAPARHNTVFSAKKRSVSFMYFAAGPTLACEPLHKHSLTDAGISPTSKNGCSPAKQAYIYKQPGCILEHFPGSLHTTCTLYLGCKIIIFTPATLPEGGQTLSRCLHTRHVLSTWDALPPWLWHSPTSAALQNSTTSVWGWGEKLSDG